MNAHNIVSALLEEAEFRTPEQAFAALYPGYRHKNFWDITYQHGLGLGFVDEHKHDLAKQWWPQGQLVRLTDGRAIWMWVYPEDLMRR